MARIYCPQCGGELSDTCKKCVHCGHPLKTVRTFIQKHKKWIIGVAILAVIVVGLFVFLYEEEFEDPFAGLRKGMTRERVDEILTKNGYERTTSAIPAYAVYKGTISGRDIELSFRFAADEGEERTLRYGYASFKDNYESEEELREQEEDFLYEMVDFYEEKYGSPTGVVDLQLQDNQAFSYEWKTEDDVEIGIYTFDRKEGYYIAIYFKCD